MLLLAFIVMTVMVLTSTLVWYVTTDAGTEQAARVLYEVMFQLDQQLPINSPTLSQGQRERGFRLSLGKPADSVAMELSGVPRALTSAMRRNSLGAVRVSAATPASKPIFWYPRTRAPDQWLGFIAEPLLPRALYGSLLASALSAVVALALGWRFARAITAPLERITEGAEAIVNDSSELTIALTAPAEVHALHAALAKAGHAMRQATQAREIALSGIAHDLRTPLARLRIAMELESTQLGIEGAAMVRDIEEMEAMLSHALAMARGSYLGSPVQIDLHALIKEILDMRSSTWEYNGTPNAPVSVDLQSLRRVLNNLLDNAERHGALPRRISLRRGLDTDGLDTAEIRIENAQATTTVLSDGIGLRVCKNLAEQHRWRFVLNVGADRELGQVIAALSISCALEPAISSSWRTPG